jgi:hypothetical protein
MSADKVSAQPPEGSSGAVPPASAEFDARSYLERTLERHAGDLMTIRQIPHTCAYRVNWYDRSVAGSAAVAGLSIRYIRKSQFLFCRIGADGKPAITYPVKQ